MRTYHHHAITNRVDNDHDCSFVKLPDSNSDYFTEAMDKFRSMCESRKLVANIDYREGQLLHLRLMDPSNPTSASDASVCINIDMVREGLATLDKTGCKYVGAYPEVLKSINLAKEDAKRERFGMFEFGDIGDGDDI